MLAHCYIDTDWSVKLVHPNCPPSFWVKTICFPSFSQIVGPGGWEQSLAFQSNIKLFCITGAPSVPTVQRQSGSDTKANGSIIVNQRATIATTRGSYQEVGTTVNLLRGHIQAQPTSSSPLFPLDLLSPLVPSYGGSDKYRQRYQ